MTDDTSTPTGEAATDDPSGAAGLLASMRAQLEVATTDLGRLTEELEERSQALAEAEAVADAVLGVTDVVLVVVGADRRVRALSRGAADLAGGSGPHVGRPLSAVLPEEVAAVAAERLDAAEGGDVGAGTAAEGGEVGDDSAAAGTETEADEPGEGRLAIDLLEGGGAVLVMHDR